MAEVEGETESSNTIIKSHFKKEAKGYDTKFANIQPVKDALNLNVSIAFTGLPADANILCVGVGTGDDILNLAPQHPNWKFTAVDPESKMLEICKEKLQDNGLIDRCTFHEGYLDSLPECMGIMFDGATSLLVSHLIADEKDFLNYYNQINLRLKPGGILVNADLAWNKTEPNSQKLFDHWINMIATCEMTSEQVEQYRHSILNVLDLKPPNKIENLIESCGFEKPVHIYKSSLMHSWSSTKI